MSIEARKRQKRGVSEFDPWEPPHSHSRSEFLHFPLSHLPTFTHYRQYNAHRATWAVQAGRSTPFFRMPFEANPRKCCLGCNPHDQAAPVTHSTTSKDICNLWILLPLGSHSSGPTLELRFGVLIIQIDWWAPPRTSPIWFVPACLKNRARPEQENAYARCTLVRKT